MLAHLQLKLKKPPDKAGDLPPFRKAPGIDIIAEEALKAGGKLMTEMLDNIFNALWVHEKTPTD